MASRLEHRENQMNNTNQCKNKSIRFPFVLALKYLVHSDAG
jgi:hypothetical protein